MRARFLVSSFCIAAAVFWSTSVRATLITDTGDFGTSGVIVTDYELVASKRISRTEFEYTYRAAIEIPDANETHHDVKATFIETIYIAADQIVDGVLEFGSVAPGQRKKSLDTFTIIHDRRATGLAPELIGWSVSARNWLDFDHVALGGDILYFFDNETLTMSRYDVVSREWLSPSALSAPVVHLLATSDRLYVADVSNKIRYLELESGQTDFRDFSATAGRVVGLIQIGPDLVSFQEVAPSYTFRVVHPEFPRVDAVTPSSVHGAVRSVSTTGSGKHVYYLESNSTGLLDSNPEQYHLVRETLMPASPYAYEKIQTQETYHKDSRMVVSPSDDFLIVGNSVVQAATLQAITSLASPFSDGRPSVDALWIDGEVIWNDARISSSVATITDEHLRSRSTEPVSQAKHMGFFPHRDGLIWVLSSHGHRVIVKAFSNARDLDGDGVQNLIDDFPWHDWKSIDSDRDGIPDEVTSGSEHLENVDLFPTNPLCHSADHSDANAASQCRLDDLIDAYEPESIFEANGTVFLLDRDAGRVYRWSVTDADHLPPIDVNRSPGGWQSPVKVRSIKYWPSFDVAAVWYDDGCISNLSVTLLESTWIHCGATDGFSEMIPVGQNLLFAKRFAGTTIEGRTLDFAGRILHEIIFDLSSDGATAQQNDGQILSSTMPIILTPPVFGCEYAGFTWNESLLQLFFQRSCDPTASPARWRLQSVPLSRDGDFTGAPIDHPVIGNLDHHNLTWAPDSKRLLYPDGKIYNAANRSVDLDLQTQVMTAVWTGDGITAIYREPPPLFVKRPISGDPRYIDLEYIEAGGPTRFLRWDSSFNLVADSYRSDYAFALLEVNDGKLLVYQKSNGTPGFERLD